MKIGSILSYPRVLVYLRQIARELKRANDLAEAKFKAENQSPKVSRLVEINQVSTSDWNKQWKKDHPKSEEDLE